MSFIDNTLSNTELAQQVLPADLILFHRDGNIDEVRARAKQSVCDLAAAEDFDCGVAKTLMLLAILDHMLDSRTSGMIQDYLNF